MNEQLRDAFGGIRAEADLKDRTLEFLRGRISGYAGERTSRRRSLAAAIACLVLMLAGLGVGYRDYFTPVSAISIDVGPSVELGVNRFGRVLSVERFQDGGPELSSALDVRFMDYVDAVDRVLRDETIVDCLAQDEVLSILVVSEDGARQEEMLANLERCAAGRGDVRCGAGNFEDVPAAHTHGLSLGKYRAFLELQALDPGITPEDVRGWTMREIRDRIDALSGASPDGGREEPGHHGQGGGHRNGWGT